MQHITAHCPYCKSRYQLDPSMKGQWMRCPNPNCREVFEVPKSSKPPDSPKKVFTGKSKPAPPPTSAPAPGPRDRGAAPTKSPPRTSPPRKYGENLDAVEVVEEAPPPPAPAQPDVPSFAEEEIPMLPVEALIEDPAPLPPPTLPPDPPREEVAPDWRLPPPVRTGSYAAPAPVPPGKLFDEAPGEVAWRDQPARPVEEADLDVLEEIPEATPEPEAEEPDLSRLPTGFRWERLLLVAAILVVALAGAAGTVWLVLQGRKNAEEEAYQLALKEYEDRQFSGAADRLRKMAATDYAASARRPLYEFLADLAEVRDQGQGLNARPVEGYDRLLTLLEAHKNNPALKERRRDVWEALHALAPGIVAEAERKGDRAALDKARTALRVAAEYRPDDVSDAAQVQAVQGQIAQVEAKLARAEERQALVAQGRAYLRKPTDTDLEDFARMIRIARFTDDADVQDILKQLDGAVQQNVRWVPLAPARQEPKPLPVESGVLIAPLVGGPPQQPPPGERVIPALARGVLYALSQNNGQVAWAARVGLDTSTLPLRLPATLNTPELFLVVSADRNTLRALVAGTGQPFWEHQLDAPCLGRPVVVNRRAYVPTYSPRGRVYEVNVLDGTALGYFEVGQPLSVGGAWQEGTDLVYVPGDSRNVYVLNVGERKVCERVLRSGHPSGSLRGEPVVVSRVTPRGGALPPGSAYLILNQTDGLTGTKVRAFSLPVERTDQAPAAEARVRGWSWFPPYCDTEKLAVATDVGAFHLFGISQLRNEDPALFPETRGEYRVGAAAKPSRAQVVHAEENDFWVLANGELHRLYFNKFGRQGPEVLELWEDRPLLLGPALQAGQALNDDGVTTLFLVTQAPQGVLATAVEADTGKVKWQRQLGLECDGDPVALGHEVLAADRAGALFRADGAKPLPYLDERGKQWHTGGQIVASAREEGAVPPLLLPDPDGAAVYQILCPGEGKQLVVRRYQPGAEGAAHSSVEKVIPIRDRLAGIPAVGSRGLLIPLANGSLFRVRLPLDGNAAGEEGPGWRVRQIEDPNPVYVLPLGGDDFLVTDGANQLRRMRWPQGMTWGEVGRVELSGRIAAPPVLLPGAEGGESQIAVADARGTLTFLSGADFREVRVKPLGGKVTAGPFVRAGKLGVLLDKRHLVWIDPQTGEEAWRYESSGDIVGRPQLVHGLVVVADLSGRFVGLDPATGQPAGPGYTLLAGAAPATTPAAFGTEQALVPLTDGTMFLLPLRNLR